MTLTFFGISETSATITTQKIFSSQMNRLGYKSLWSTPVADHSLRSDGRPSLRGKAGGVALNCYQDCHVGMRMAQFPINGLPAVESFIR